LTNQHPQLVWIAPQDGALKPMTSPRALMRLDRRGVPMMNSQLPMIYPAIVTGRMDEQIAKAEQARVLRSVTRRPSATSALRLTVATLLVRLGQRLSPPAPVRDRDSEHVLIRLAR
jgi:hypothetical protein